MWSSPHTVDEDSATVVGGTRDAGVYEDVYDTDRPEVAMPVHGTHGDRLSPPSGTRPGRTRLPTPSEYFPPKGHTHRRARI